MEPEVPVLLEEPERNLGRRILFVTKAAALFETHGELFETYRDFCDAVGLNYTYFRKQFSMDTEFREKIESIQERNRKRKQPPSIVPVRARERWPNLDFWKGMFLEKYRECSDPMDAADLVDRVWKQIQEALDSDAEFKAGFSEIEEEIAVRVKAKHTKMALEGRGAAAKQFLDLREPSRPPKPSTNPAAAQQAYEKLVAAMRPAPKEAEDAPEVAGPELAPS